MKETDKILNIYKPKGITSHDVVDIVRKKYKTKKVGHAGTLDPMAEGVLIILIGDATKRQKDFMDTEKEYIAEIVLGIETDTYDIEGTVIRKETGNIKINKKQLENTLKSFTGNIKQEVPPYSAVKIKGKPLYKYAREGKLEGIELPKRKVFIKEIELLETGELHLGGVPRAQHHLRGAYPSIKIRVVCSKGTYIRSLANDIGKKLGMGATLVSLGRARVGSFNVEDSKKLGRLC